MPAMSQNGDPSQLPKSIPMPPTTTNTAHFGSWSHRSAMVEPSFLSWCFLQRLQLEKRHCHTAARPCHFRHTPSLLSHFILSHEYPEQLSAASYSFPVEVGMGSIRRARPHKNNAMRDSSGWRPLPQPNSPPKPYSAVS